MKILLAGGQLCREEGLAPGDLLIADGKIAACGDCRGLAGDAEVIDAAGAYVLPGLIDLHVHLDDRISGFLLADDYESGSRVALQNGITTIGGFVTQGGEETLAEAVGRARSRAQGRCHTDYLWHLTPTRFGAGDWPEICRFAEHGWRTFKFYTTYRESGIYTAYDRLAEIMERLKPFGARFLVHAEDDAMLQRLAARCPGHDAADHARMRPAAVEQAAVERLLLIAAATGAPLHFVHISTAAAAERILAAKGDAAVTCETGPHYLFLDESWLQRQDGHRWLCTPPLRPAVEAEALRRLARQGAFDLYASDHCPFRRADKDAGAADSRRVPKGIAGVGALAPLVFQLYGGEPGTAFPEMSRRLAANPARAAGIYPIKGALQPGSDADLLVLTVSATDREIVSGGGNAYETYPGWRTPLRVRDLFLRGRPLIRNGVPLPMTEPQGRCLWPS
jgi:dihydropyrimidinase